MTEDESGAAVRPAGPITTPSIRTFERNMPLGIIDRAAKWLRSNWLYLLAVGVNLALVFLPFYDSNNIPDALSYASHLTNSAPAFSYNKWVAGPFIFAVYVPMYLAYIISGFSLYAAFTVAKLLFFLGLLALAYTLKIATRPMLGRRSGVVFYFTLLNPAWLFVNYVWVEFDILPVALLALGYVLLRGETQESPNNARLLAAVACLTISTFFYWFAAAAIPSILIYERGKRQRVRLLTALAGMFGGMALVLVVVMSGGLSIFLSTFVGGNPTLNRASQFGLQYFFPLSTSGYILMVLGLIVVAPLVLRRLGASEPVSIFVAISLLIYTSTIALPDNYLAAFPFGALAIAGYTTGARLPKEYRLNLRLWCSAAFPITGIALINVLINNTQPDGVGVFYWGFDLFHQNIIFLVTPASVQSFYAVYNVAVLLALYLSVGAVLLGTPRLEVSTTHLKDAGPARPSRGPIRFQIGRLARRRRQLLLWTGFVGILVVASFAFNAVLPNSIQYEGNGTAPTYAVTPLFWPDNGNVVRPIPGATFGQAGPNLTVYPVAPPLAFGRWFDGQNVNLSVSTELGAALPSSAQVLNGTPFSISVLNLTAPDASQSTTLVPSGSQRTVSVPGPPYPLLGRTGNVSLLDGLATEWYNFSTPSFEGRNFVLAYEITVPGPIGTSLLHIQTTNFSVALSAFPGYVILGYAGASTGYKFVNQVVPLDITAGTWQFLQFSPSPTGLVVDLAGHDLQISAPILSPTGENVIRFGVPYSQPGGADFVFTGQLTPLYVSGTPFNSLAAFSAEVSNNGVDTYLPLGSPEINFSIVDTPSGSVLTVTGHRFSCPDMVTELWIGKFVPGSYSVEISIEQLQIDQSSPNTYALIPVFWTAVTPWLVIGVFLVVCASSRRSGRGG